MSVSDTVSSVTFGPLKGLGTQCHLLKVTQVICQKCACLQKCCVNSSATRLTPGCSRVIRQDAPNSHPVHQAVLAESRPALGHAVSDACKPSVNLFLLRINSCMKIT